MDDAKSKFPLSKPHSGGEDLPVVYSKEQELRLAEPSAASSSESEVGTTGF